MQSSSSKFRMAAVFCFSMHHFLPRFCRAPSYFDPIYCDTHAIVFGSYILFEAADFEAFHVRFRSVRYTSTSAAWSQMNFALKRHLVLIGQSKHRSLRPSSNAASPPRLPTWRRRDVGRYQLGDTDRWPRWRGAC